MTPSACILIPQWLFAVAGFVACPIGVYGVYRMFKEDWPPTMWNVIRCCVVVLMMVVGALSFLYGIAPYLPCWSVIP